MGSGTWGSPPAAPWASWRRILHGSRSPGRRPKRPPLAAASRPASWGPAARARTWAAGRRTEDAPACETQPRSRQPRWRRDGGRRADEHEGTRDERIGDSRIVGPASSVLDAAPWLLFLVSVLSMFLSLVICAVCVMTASVWQSERAASKLGAENSQWMTSLIFPARRERVYPALCGCLASAGCHNSGFVSLLCTMSDGRRGRQGTMTSCSPAGVAFWCTCVQA
mmetsp:Transcript_10503/g.30824  ORF Transcript_10503/g.30824 Transcript_10503/m.30824 type:complete len:224 (+) Transcript_10503:169-840(+)